MQTFPAVQTDLSNLPQPDREALLAAWAQFVRSGGIHKGKAKVRAQTVQVALRAVGTTIELDGKRNPLDGQKGSYPKAIKQLLEGYKREDPPPAPRLAIPLAVPRFLNAQGQTSTDTKTKTIGHMAIVAFFFLLRAGEYTFHAPTEQRRTYQFRLADVAFWEGTKLLPLTTSTRYLLDHCTAATLSILNQKNGKRNQSIHQEALHTDICPVKALIQHVKHIWRYTRDTNTKLGTYYAAQTVRQLTTSDMSRAIKNAVTNLGLHKQGLTRDLVGSHSLRAGGAMAMYLNGIPHDTIRKIGRWASDTFLMYIHEQVAALSANVSTQMAQPFPFHNVHFQRHPNSNHTQTMANED